MSRPHQKLISILQGMGYTTVAEQPAGVYKLDIYLPECHAVIEYNGPAHWGKRDAARAQWLWENFSLPTLIVKDVTDEGAVAGEIALFLHDIDKLGEVSTRRRRARGKGWNG